MGGLTERNCINEKETHMTLVILYIHSSIGQFLYLYFSCWKPALYPVGGGEKGCC